MKLQIHRYSPLVRHTSAEYSPFSFQAVWGLSSPCKARFDHISKTSLPPPMPLFVRVEIAEAEQSHSGQHAARTEMEISHMSVSLPKIISLTNSCGLQIACIRRAPPPWLQEEICSPLEGWNQPKENFRLISSAFSSSRAKRADKVGKSRRGSLIL